MSFFHPILEAPPSWLHFLPTGGQNGNPCWQIDAQGSTPSILFMRRTAPSDCEWAQQVEIDCDLTQLPNTDNGYEGIGAFCRLLKPGATAPIDEWNNQLLSGAGSPLWHNSRDSWHRVVRTFEIPDTAAPTDVDIAVVVKAPVGGKAFVQGLSLVNHYARRYEMSVTAPSTSITLTRFDKVVNVLSYITFQRVYWLSFLDTIPVRIPKGAEISTTFQAILGGYSDSTDDVPVTIAGSIKLTSPDGTHAYKQISKEVYDTNAMELREQYGTLSFTAEAEYTQVEIVLWLYTKFGRVHGASMGHKGISWDMTVRKNLLDSD